MSEIEPLVLLREPREGRPEVTINTLVALASDTSKRGTVLALPGVGGMMAVHFENEDRPRALRLDDVRAVVATVQVYPDDKALVTYYDTGVSTNGIMPGRLGVWLYGNGNCSLVCDGWPVGEAEDILPANLRHFGRKGELAEAAALWALGRLCVTRSDIFAAHAMSVAMLRQFVKARAAELNITVP